MLKYLPSLRALLDLLHQSVLQMNRHFIDSKKEIAHDNSLSLLSVSSCGLILELLLLAISPRLISDWEITIWHLLMLPFFLVFQVVGYLLHKRGASYRVTHICVLLFTFLLLMLVLCLDLEPFDTSSATMIAVAMSVVPVLFIIPFHETTISLLIVLACFFVVNSREINPSCVGRNIFHGILGCTCGILVSWVVTNVRAEDNKGRQVILHESQYDALTEIPNRLSAERACCAYLAADNATGSLVVLDIDFFKEVNDKYGHSMGDEVLSLLGQCIRSVFRETDITGRIGGDEFIILMKNTTDVAVIRNKMTQLSEMVHNLVEERAKISVTCSYGAILFQPELKISYSSLFNMADKVLYHAKQTGKNKGDVMTIAEYNRMMAARKIMLVVDDVEVDRAVLKNIFVKDYDVIEASNGQEAVDIIEKHRGIIGVMLLDIMMPVMGGHDVLKWLRAQTDIEQFPVIAISSDSNEELEAFELGVSDMITKPFNPEVVRMRVNRTMRKGR